MLFYLNNQSGYVKIKDIADYLEIGEREVRRYRDELEMADFSIDNQTGRDGGYKLQQKVKFALGLNQTETLLLNLSVRTNNDVFKTLNSTLTLVSKMKQDLVIGDNYIDDETLYKLVRIRTSIDNLTKIQIKYYSFRYGEGTYLVEAYMIKILREKYYLFAMHKGVLKSYTVDNIHSIEISDEKYEINQLVYEKEKNESAYGIYRGKTKYSVKIEVFGNLNKFIDSFFNDKAIIVEEKSKSVIYTFDTYNLHECMYAILSLGSHVKIIAPQELISMYKEEISKIQSYLR